MTVYLDNAGRSPLRQEAREALLAYLDMEASGANPSALHQIAKESASLLDASRKRIAAALGSGIRSSEIHFTSGGTEANNMAILGIALGARKKDSKRDTVLISAIEHSSIKELQKPLEKLGFKVIVIPVTENGIVEPEALSSLLHNKVALVSVMSVNNEIGTIQPIHKLATLAHEAGALFHTDVVQAFTHIPLELSCVDAASLSAHKIGALEGTGALYLRSKTPFKPTRFGGEQERGVRAGTQSVCGAYVFSRVAEHAENERPKRFKITENLRATLLDALKGTEISPTIDVLHTPTLPSILSLAVPYVNKELLLMALDSEGFCISAGSACKASLPGPTETILALGKGTGFAKSVIRVSFDDRISPYDMKLFGETLTLVAHVIRKKKRYL